MDFTSHHVATASVATAVLGVVAWMVLTRARASRGAPPTVPSWVPFLGSTLAFSKDPVAFLRQCQAKYGSVFSVYLAGKTMTFFVSPKSYSVLLKHKALSHKPAFEDISKKALDQSPAFARYTQALMPEVPVVDYHKLVHPHLQHSAAVGALIEKTLSQQRRALSQFASQRVSLLSFVERCIFESGTRVLLGDTVVDENPSLWDDFRAFDKSFPLFVAGVPSLFLPSASKARRNLVHALDSNKATDAAAIIQKRTEALKATFPSEVLAPLDAAKESMALLWAASANSIPTAYWSLFYLLQNPNAWNAVRDEVRLHLGDAAGAWTGEQLGKCVFLASAVDEALRLSASSLMMRVATEDVDLKLPDSQVHLAKGSNVMIFPSLGHFDEVIFPLPRTFQFDRFVNATSAQLEAFKPFGMGITMCPGRNFAKNQVKMFVALVMLETKRVALVPGYVEPQHDPSRLGLGILPPTNDAIQIDLEK